MELSTFERADLERAYRQWLLPDQRKEVILLCVVATIFVLFAAGDLGSRGMGGASPGRWIIRGLFVVSSVGVALVARREDSYKRLDALDTGWWLAFATTLIWINIEARSAGLELVGSLIIVGGVLLPRRPMLLRLGVLGLYLPVSQFVALELGGEAEIPAAPRLGTVRNPGARHRPDLCSLRPGALSSDEPLAHHTAVHQRCRLRSHQPRDLRPVHRGALPGVRRRSVGWIVAFMLGDGRRLRDAGLDPVRPSFFDLSQHGPNARRIRSVEIEREAR